MKKSVYSFNTLRGVATRIMAHQPGLMQRARCKALAWLLPGLLLWRAATLSGMSRGVALANEQKPLIGQLQRAHRLMKNDQFDAWAMASALYGYATQPLSRVLIAVDWTDDGQYKVLEASLGIEGRAVPLYCRAVHKDEYAGRQTTLQLTMWYALIAMRREGQTVVVMADRGLAKFAWLGPCPDYRWMHLVIRLKANTILTWDDLSAPLRQWPLWAGETVQIGHARLGVERQLVSGVCIANLGEVGGVSLYLACAAEDLALAVADYGKRAWVEQQNRDLKTGFLWRHARLATRARRVIQRFFQEFLWRHARLATAARIEQLWVVLGLAFCIRYCTESLHDPAFAQRLSRRYKDGRRDLSWLSAAKCAALTGNGDLVLRPFSAQ
jgi:hypothetical protein